MDLPKKMKKAASAKGLRNSTTGFLYSTISWQTTANRQQDSRKKKEEKKTKI